MADILIISSQAPLAGIGSSLQGQSATQAGANSALAQGTLVSGTVIGKDAGGNFVLRTDQGNITVRSDAPLTYNSDVVIRIGAGSGSGTDARILTVNGESFSSFSAPPPIVSDSVSPSLLAQTYAAAPVTEPAAPAPAVRGVVISATPAAAADNAASAALPASGSAVLLRAVVIPSSTPVQAAAAGEVSAPPTAATAVPVHATDVPEAAPASPASPTVPAPSLSTPAPALSAANSAPTGTASPGAAALDTSAADETTQNSVTAPVPAVASEAAIPDAQSAIEQTAVVFPDTVHASAAPAPDAPVSPAPVAATTPQSAATVPADDVTPAAVAAVSSTPAPQAANEAGAPVPATVAPSAVAPAPADVSAGAPGLSAALPASISASAPDLSHAAHYAAYASQPAATQPATNAIPTATASAALPAQVTGVQPNGTLALATQAGNLLVRPDSTAGFQPGNTVFIEPAPGAVTAATIAAAAPASFAALSGNWAALGDIAAFLTERDPAAFESDDPSPAESVAGAGGSASLTSQLPQLGPAFASSSLSFLSALMQNDVRGMLGDTVVDAIRRGGRQDLLERFSTEAGIAGGALAPQTATPGNWQAVYLPFVYQEAVHEARIYVKRDPNRKDAKTGAQNAGDTRFVVEVDLSEIGPLQMDGLIRKQTGPTAFDLVVRSRNAFSEEAQEAISAIYHESALLTGFRGSIHFQTAREFPVKPRDEMAAALNRSFTV